MRQGWLAIAAPDFLVRVGEDRIAHFRKARSVIGAIFLSDLFDSEIGLFHDELPSQIAVPLRWFPLSQELADAWPAWVNRSRPP